jgi:Type II secretion system (T2SS), protein M subtype b
LTAMPQALNALVEGLGLPGKAAVALLLSVTVFHQVALKPLSARNESLARSEDRAMRQHRPSDPSIVRTASPSSKLATFYRFFEREESTTDWLAKLYAIADKSGVSLRLAEYQLIKGPGRLDRYEIALPLSGDYAQIRAFLENALIEIPVLSLDQVNFRRKRTNDPNVETDVRLTLHVLRQ